MEEPAESNVPEGILKIRNLFKDMGMEANDDVCGILLEPLYNLTQSILLESKNLATFCNRNEIIEADVQMATNRLLDNVDKKNEFEINTKLAEQINATNIPSSRSATSIHFPTDRNCLFTMNYDLVEHAIDNRPDTPPTCSARELSFLKNTDVTKLPRYKAPNLNANNAVIYRKN